MEPRQTKQKQPVRLGTAKFTVMSESALGNRTGNNGQVQLWQFLLELLTEKEHREVIHWLGDDGEFKLENPEMVAQLWGNRKNKQVIMQLTKRLIAWCNMSCTIHPFTEHELREA